MQELLGVVGWGIIGIGVIGCKLTRGNFRWTWGCALQIGGAIVGARGVFRRIEGFAIQHMLTQLGLIMLLVLCHVVFLLCLGP